MSTDVEAWAAARGITLGTPGIEPTPHREPPTFSVDITIEASASLDTRDVWPDGDWPDAPTTEDVIAVIQRTTLGAHDLISQWSLDDAIEVSVDGTEVTW